MEAGYPSSIIKYLEHITKPLNIYAFNILKMVKAIVLDIEKFVENSTESKQPKLPNVHLPETSEESMKYEW